ncbi:MAG: energy transducer TonB [Thermodesulfobacteriota bacterium]
MVSALSVFFRIEVHTSGRGLINIQVVSRGADKQERTQKSKTTVRAHTKTSEPTEQPASIDAVSPIPSPQRQTSEPYVKSAPIQADSLTLSPPHESAASATQDRKKSSRESSQQNSPHNNEEQLSLLSASSSSGEPHTLPAVEVTAHPDYRLNPKPPYPPSARRKGEQGTVLLRVRVLEDGTVSTVELKRSSGHEALDDSALNAVKRWVFYPGRRGGIPVASWVTVPVKFVLRSG